MFVKTKPQETAGRSEPTHNHDPYFGLSAEERGFMESLRDWVKTTYPSGTPFKLEVTNGVSRDRLTLNPENDEVFMIKRKAYGNGKRQISIDIMSEEEAKYEAGQPDGPPGSSSADPCTWWVWNGVDWICVAYGN